MTGILSINDWTNTEVRKKDNNSHYLIHLHKETFKKKVNIMKRRTNIV